MSLLSPTLVVEYMMADECGKENERILAGLKNGMSFGYRER